MSETVIPKVEMRGISKSFPGVLANDCVDLMLHRSEVLALLGENGAGKSTLMNVLCGLYRPDKGEIYIMAHMLTFILPAMHRSMALAWSIKTSSLLIR